MNAELLKELFFGRKQEPPLRTKVSGYLNLINSGIPYRIVLFQIRDSSNLSSEEKKVLITEIQKHYDPTWEWKGKNGEWKLRGQESKAPQA